jgi:glycosyltransferase involved in cell wall biosynthesis
MNTPVAPGIEVDVPLISPVPTGIERPLWSVMIPTFNCAQFLRRTLESVLEQDPGPGQMHIEVVDDCSSADDPQAVVDQVGRGRVEYYRKPRNEGAVCNFNTCVERSRGHLVHILHGDDYIAPGFYSEFGATFERSQSCAAVFSRVFYVDEQDELMGLSDFVTSLKEPSTDPSDLIMENPIRTPAAVVRRSFYEQYGGFSPSLIHVADWEVWTRTIVRSGARMLNKPLAFYRLSSGMHTTRVHRNADCHRDYFRLAGIWQNQALPGFNYSAFHRMVLRNAWNDWQNSRAANDHEAATANYGFWREHCSWDERIPGLLIDWLRQRKFQLAKAGRLACKAGLKWFA